MTTTNPDVPLPAGAVFGDTWEGAEPERVITGPDRRYVAVGGRGRAN